MDGGGPWLRSAEGRREERKNEGEMRSEAGERERTAASGEGEELQ